MTVLWKSGPPSAPDFKGMKIQPFFDGRVCEISLPEAAPIAKEIASFRVRWHDCGDAKTIPIPLTRMEE
jgi:hypothetical protein